MAFDLFVLWRAVTLTCQWFGSAAEQVTGECNSPPFD